MNRKRRLSCLVAGIVLASAGCMTPGYQYLEPPGFSSTYFQVTQGAAMRTVRPAAMATRERYELGNLSTAVQVPLQAQSDERSTKSEVSRLPIPDAEPQRAPPR